MQKKLGLLFGCVLLLWTGGLSAGDNHRFEVVAAGTQLKDGVYRLDARILFVLSEPVSEALHNGVPQVIEIQMQVFRSRDYLWNETLASVSQRFRLAYHALSERYVVENINTASRSSYPSLGEALYHIGLVRDFPLIDAKLLAEGKAAYGAIRATLDIESLPTPIRLGAYTSRNWWLGSEWVSWPLQP